MTDLADTSWIPRYLTADMAAYTLDDIPYLIRHAWDWALHFPETGGESIEDLMADLKEIIDREKARLGDEARIEAAARRAARHAAYAAREKVATEAAALQRMDQRVDVELDRLIAEGIAKGINPRGCFVYLLWERKSDKTPVYVGKSTRVLARIGEHLMNPVKKHRIGWVTFIRCEDIRRMEATERRLIGLYQPVLNIQGVGGRESEGNNGEEG